MEQNLHRCWITIYSLKSKSQYWKWYSANDVLLSYGLSFDLYFSFQRNCGFGVLHELGYDRYRNLHESKCWSSKTKSVYLTDCSSPFTIHLQLANESGRHNCILALFVQRRASEAWDLGKQSKAYEFDNWPFVPTTCKLLQL